MQKGLMQREFDITVDLESVSNSIQFVSSAVRAGAGEVGAEAERAAEASSARSAGPFEERLSVY